MSSTIHDDDLTDSFSFVSSTMPFEQQQQQQQQQDRISISNFIDDFITKTLPALPNFQSSIDPPYHLLDLSESILELIISFLDQHSVLNVILSCSDLIIAARKRLYKRIAVVNSVAEVKALRNERVLPTTIIVKSKFIECLDVIRMGDSQIANYVMEIMCFAELEWSSSETYTINDSWYLTAPLLKNLKTLIWPKLPIVKYQVLQIATRLKLKTLAVGFSSLSEENAKSCDNSVLAFPAVENLIINLDQNDNIDDVILLSKLVVYGDVLKNLKSLTISGCLNQVISLNNTKPALRLTMPRKAPPPSLSTNDERVLPQTPVKQMIKYNESADDDFFKTGRLSLKDKLKQSFKSPTSAVKVTQHDFKVISSPSLEPPEKLQTLKEPKSGGRNFNEQRHNNVNSSVWSHILMQFGVFGKLQLKSLTLDKVLLQDDDIDCLLKYLELSKLESLELSNVLIKYDELEDKVEGKGPLLNSLSPFLTNLKSLSLDIRLQSSNCGFDCYKYGNLQIRKFLASIPPLENLHLVSYEQEFFKPEYLEAHASSLKKLSLSMPEKVSSFVRLLNQNFNLVDEFTNVTRMGEDGKRRMKNALIKDLNNSACNSILIDDVSSPNLFKLQHYNQAKNRFFHEYKYQLLNFLGDQFDDYVNNLTELEEISFMGVKFRTA